jgi:hypothetical protein
MTDRNNLGEKFMLPGTSISLKRKATYEEVKLCAYNPARIEGKLL